MSMLKFSRFLLSVIFVKLCDPSIGLYAYLGTLGSVSELSAINEGVEKAYEECQRQFESGRFNCPRSYHSDIVFNRKRNLYKTTREDGLMRATLNAGVVHSLIKSCNDGMGTECGCKPGQHFDWKGCQKTFTWAMQRASNFLDPRDGQDQESLVRIHNNRVGRLIVQLTLDKHCRCHGTSGSCVLKTCWLKLESFRSIGEALLERYEKAVKIDHSSDGLNYSLEKTENNKDSLLYLDESPDYCTPDLRNGAEGTLGRTCNNNATYDSSWNKFRQNKLGTCQHLCNECGYGTMLVKRKSHNQCRCRFKWCCSVQCKPCPEEVVYVCHNNTQSAAPVY
ncbi:protein Wnt-2b-like [Brevipalpus obovatus]|uniref:protein Wnt-2b-like n=1 Tax=Brevipalpus obovatus TaxID=246614 RepID=UPI003D9E26B0